MKRWCSFTSDSDSGLHALDFGGDGTKKETASSDCAAAVHNWGEGKAGLFFILVEGKAVKTYCNAEGEPTGDGSSEASAAVRCTFQPVW